MSDWYWRVIALKAAFLLTFITSYIRADDTVQKLPFCNPHTTNDQSATNDLVLVSTLDGRLTAFITSSGAKAWDVETQPLLSSNLHHVELTSGGKWVRLVPSLRGTLYSLSGDTVEPLPFDADQLLSSSFKYSDDLVVAGGRESLWLGLDAHSGAVVYSCGTRGCSGERDSAGRRLLVLRRHSSTVRALDPRTGSEKWNFSVGEHQLALSGAECASQGPRGTDYSIGVALPEGVVALTQPDSKLLLWQKKGPRGADYSIGVALPEGVVALTQPDSKLLLWQKKLEAPIAGMWRLRGGALQSMDVLWAATKTLSADTFIQTTPPSLYIGLHEQQLYIQEGQLYAQKLASTAVSAPTSPWQLKQRARLPGPDTALQTMTDSDPNTLSLITLYGNTGQGNEGFFLYQDDTCDQAVQVTEELINEQTETPTTETDDREHHHIHVHVYSLWFWWKEVILIAVSSALLMNLMIWPRFFAPKHALLPPTPVHHLSRVVQVHYEQTPPPPSPEYSGRYENDFTPLRCLGKGGFGVVFEARNKIDHRSYAVKRITLPRRESKRERVLREVRALAKLEHEHIVRYFNAWLEEPPAHWQETRDVLWMRELEGVSSGLSDCEPSVKTSPRESPARGDSVVLNLHRDVDYEGQLSEPSKRLRSLSCNDSLSIVFDENATKDPDITTKSPLKSSFDIISDLSMPSNLSKNLASGDNDDSFIVFANSEDLNHNSKGLSEARVNTSVNKPLERVKECNEFTKIEASSVEKKKKKKGHTRHWSLDMCVKSTTDNVRVPSSKMYLYIQMQLCRRDSLHDWLRNNRTYSSREGKIKTLFSQIVSAVEYVHLAGLIHRDLKPSNIFFAPDGKVKVGDFGLVTAMADSSQDGDGPPDALDVHQRHTYRVGTHLYMSPEQLRGRRYSYKVDIYSLGLVLFELLQPFGTEAERVRSLLAIREGGWPQGFSRNFSNEMEVLKLMLSEDPMRRPTAAGVRARAPLFEPTDERWHFTLPTLVNA